MGASLRETSDPHLAHARRHRRVRRVSRLEDRHPSHRAHPRARERRLLRRGSRDHGRLSVADGVALATAAARERHPRTSGLARARVLRVLHRGPGLADVDRRGGAATLTLAAVGFALAVGRYDVGAYLWIEAAFVVGTILAGVLLFSRAARRPLRRFVPAFRALRIERPIRAVYEAIHEFRARPALLTGVSLLTLGVQAVRVLAIWCAGKSVGVDLSPRPYYVMGPLLLLVMLVPFTINGIAVRESFFVSFLGTLGVGADAAFATGFLFFA